MIIPKHTQDPRVNGKIQTIGASFLESHKIKIEHEFDCVKLTLGGHTLTMDYPTAIKLSQMLRTHGKQAKKFAGDASKSWTAEAVLTDAEQNYKRGW